MSDRSIFIGYDTTQDLAFKVARGSMLRRLGRTIHIHAIVLNDVRSLGMYWREHELREGRWWDVISDAPMSTEFANTRFLVPKLSRSKWALFTDSDVLALEDVNFLFDTAQEKYAVMCVKHNHVPTNTHKMGNQLQTVYPRKNWSSVVLFNCEHPANEKLTIDMINTVPGRDLHRFCWIEDDELIGDIHPRWNWLAGHSSEHIVPSMVHYTDGTPNMPGYENTPYASAWWDEAKRLRLT